MKTPWIRIAEFGLFCAAMVMLSELSSAHVTLQTSQPLRPGVGFANITLNVPNERHVDNTKVTLDVPEAFLKAGGRLNRVIYPPGWTVTLEKKEKPSDVYSKEKDERAKRDAQRDAAGAEQGAQAVKTEDEKQEQQIMDELRKKWITKVTFEGGVIPPDGFQQFLISFQLPDAPGKYRFAAVQTYADGKEVSWSELVEGAEHPAASLNIEETSVIESRPLPLALSLAALLISLLALTRRARQKNRAGANGSIAAAESVRASQPSLR